MLSAPTAHQIRVAMPGKTAMPAEIDILPFQRRRLGEEKITLNSRQAEHDDADGLLHHVSSWTLRQSEIKRPEMRRLPATERAACAAGR